MCLSQRFCINCNEQETERAGKKCFKHEKLCIDRAKQNYHTNPYHSSIHLIIFSSSLLSFHIFLFVACTQVKRLAMGLLRTTEESRPLVHNTSSPTSGSMHTISDGYVNEGICDPDKLISSKFGDSCRKSLTSVLDKGYKDNCEFDLKKNFLRETSSGKCGFIPFSLS